MSASRPACASGQASLPGQFQLDLGAGLFCAGIGLALDLLVAAIAGVMCSVVTGMNNTVLVDELNHAAGNNDYMSITLWGKLGIPTSAGLSNVSYSPTPPDPCDT